VVAAAAAAAAVFILSASPKMMARMTEKMKTAVTLLLQRVVQAEEVSKTGS